MNAATPRLPVLLNEAEAIIEPFWDERLSPLAHYTLRNLRGPALSASSPAVAAKASTVGDKPEAPPAPTQPVSPEPAPAAPAATPAPAPASPAPKKVLPLLDEGLLDPNWFGAEVTFTKHEEVDFYWIKPGLDLTGRVLLMKPWDDPTMLRKGRDGKDNAKAATLTDTIPATLRAAISGALKDKVKVSRSEGDVEVIGRVVDCNAGSKAAKVFLSLGAGQENVTFDIKFVDPKTKELLAAFHHRTISGTALSSIESKLVKWAEKFGQFMAQGVVK